MICYSYFSFNDFLVAQGTHSWQLQLTGLPWLNMLLNIIIIIIITIIIIIIIIIVIIIIMLMLMWIQPSTFNLLVICSLPFSGV